MNEGIPQVLQWIDKIRELSTEARASLAKPS
jgi:hypothetical protein